MKLKEWGFIRHKPRRSSTRRGGSRESHHSSPEEDGNDRDMSATVEPMPLESTPSEPALVDRAEVIPSQVCEKRGGWQVIAGAELAVAEPTFMGLLHHLPR
jgi:hypothetical protein